MTLYNLQANKLPVQIIWAGDPASLIVNRDIVNQVYYGTQSIFDANLAVASIIDPLASITVDGSQDIWVIAASGTPTIDVTNASSSWSPSPAQIAAQINALGLATAANQSTQIVGTNSTNGYLAGTTAGALVANTGKTVGQEIAGLQATGSATGPAGGIPLLRFTNNMGKASGTNLPAGGSTSVALITNAPINQPGLEAEFTCHFSAGLGTSPFVQIIFQWVDSVSGFVTWTDYFYIPGGSGAANAITCYINGPCYGNQLSVNAINTDASAGCALDSWVVSQTSHVYERTIIKQAFFTSVNGFLNPDGFPASGVLCSADPAVAFGTSTTRLLPVWSGRILINMDNLGGASTHRFRLLDPTGLLYSATNNNKDFFGANVAAGADSFAEVVLPNGPVILELHNSGASGTEGIPCTITRIPY